MKMAASKRMDRKRFERGRFKEDLGSGFAGPDILPSMSQAGGRKRKKVDQPLRTSW
jgi:hypothetical protein